MTTKILIVEDEKNLGLTLKDYLESQGHEVELAVDVNSAKETFKNSLPDLVLMDVGLPDGNGIDLAKDFKSQNPNLKLLFLSAMNDPITRVEGLETGAEDYITKPFELRELTIRMKRFLTSKDSNNDEVVHGPLKIWFKRFEVQDALGNITTLAQKECAIFELLYQKSPEVVSRDLIIEKIWGNDAFPSNRTVDNYIVKLRKFCETDPEEHMKITSVRGVGYKLEVKND